MGPIFSNRYADALAKTLVVFGAIHWIILGCIALRGNVEALNAFNILELDLLIPSLHHGVASFALSYCAVLAGYWFAYRFLARPAGENKRSSRPGHLSRLREPRRE